MAEFIEGTWNLIAWRAIAGDGSVSYPLGADARGLLLYANDGRMSVQISGENRPELGTDDPLGGDAGARAQAYSTYLAYFGSYEVIGQSVVHHIEGSLFPEWAGREQVRPFTTRSGGLVLRTQPMRLADGSTVVNELSWARGRG